RDSQEPHRRVGVRAQLLAAAELGKVLNRVSDLLFLFSASFVAVRAQAARITEHQSARAPDTATTSAQRATSARRNLSNSSGALPTGSAPCSTRRCLTSAERAALTTAFASVLTTSRGVAAG